MKGITSEDTACVGIKCRDSDGNENVLYVDLGKKKSRRYTLINL